MADLFDSVTEMDNQDNQQWHKSYADLEMGLDHILQSPSLQGELIMIVARPKVNARTVLESAQLSVEMGLAGDNWKARGSSATSDRSAHPDMQLNIMNSRAVDVIAGSHERWPLAGDQLYVDFDLSADNLPFGAQLKIGDAIVEITPEPHLGCKKFSDRFGRDATKFVNSAIGKRVKLRGVNAKVVQAGVIRTGDAVIKLA